MFLIDIANYKSTCPLCYSDLTTEVYSLSKQIGTQVGSELHIKLPKNHFAYGSSRFQIDALMLTINIETHLFSIDFIKDNVSKEYITLNEINDCRTYLLNNNIYYFRYCKSCFQYWNHTFSCFTLKMGWWLYDKLHEVSILKNGSNNYYCLRTLDLYKTEETSPLKIFTSDQNIFYSSNFETILKKNNMVNSIAISPETSKTVAETDHLPTSLREIENLLLFS